MLYYVFVCVYRSHGGKHILIWTKIGYYPILWLVESFHEAFFVARGGWSMSLAVCYRLQKNPRNAPVRRTGKASIRLIYKAPENVSNKVQQLQYWTFHTEKTIGNFWEKSNLPVSLNVCLPLESYLRITERTVNQSFRSRFEGIINVDEGNIAKMAVCNDKQSMCKKKQLKSVCLPYNLY